MDYKELQQTDFWSFFNFKEGDEYIDLNETTKKTIEPGGFQEHINFKLNIHDSGKILNGVLELAREWIGNESNLDPFAKDICKSFIIALSTEESSDSLADIVDGIMSITGIDDNVIYANEPPKQIQDRLPVTKQALMCYMGLESQFLLELPKLKIYMENREAEGKDILHIKIDLL